MNAAQVGLPPELAHESRFQQLTRVGFGARGLLYIVIALLVLRTGRTEDLTGGIEYVRQGAGSWLVAVMAVGMIAYGLWRLADAALGMENPGREWKHYIRRAAAGVIGCIYLYLAYKAVSLLVSGHMSSGGGTQRQAETVLDLPGGSVVLAVAGLVMLAAGGNQILKAGKCEFMRRLHPRAHRRLVKWLGRAGYAARGVIFIAVAYLIVRAAIDRSPSRAGGMEQALDFLRGPVEYAVAAGLMLFGAFSLVEGVYRRIHEPPVDGVADQIRAKTQR